jgi:hypothetical protein
MGVSVATTNVFVAGGSTGDTVAIGSGVGADVAGVTGRGVEVNSSIAGVLEQAKAAMTMTLMLMSDFI